MKWRIFILIILFIANTCLANNKNVTETNKYVAALKKVTDVMVIDVASPVAASRYYAYITLTSYECISVFNNKLNPSFSGHINGYENIQIDAKLINESDAKLASILSIY